MKNITRARDAVRDLEEIDGALRQALGAAYLGATRNTTEVLVHLADDANITTAEAALDAAIAAIDRTKPAPSARRAAALQNARDGLATADFTALATAIDNAASAAALRPILRAMLRLIWRIAVMQGLNDKNDPGE